MDITQTHVKKGYYSPADYNMHYFYVMYQIQRLLRILD